jgi:hypothetical protein
MIFWALFCHSLPHFQQYTLEVGELEMKTWQTNAYGNRQEAEMREVPGQMTLGWN